LSIEPTDLGNSDYHTDSLVYAEATRRAFFQYFSKPDEKASPQSLFYAMLKYGKAASKDVSSHWKKTLAMYEKLDDEELKNDKFIKRVIEEIKYDLAYDATRSYYDLKISGENATKNDTKTILNKQIKDKKEALTELERQFLEVAQMFAGIYTVAAIVELGHAYDDYAETIKNSYIPSFLDEDQSELYRMKMEDRAYPYQVKATTAYLQALEFANKYHVYTDATAEATRRLGEFQAEYEASNPERIERIKRQKEQMVELTEKVNMLKISSDKLARRWAGGCSDSTSTDQVSCEAGSCRESIEEILYSSDSTSTDQTTCESANGTWTAETWTASCPQAVESGVIEMAQQMLETGGELIEANDIDMAGDVMPFIEDSLSSLDEMKEVCAGTAVPPEDGSAPEDGSSPEEAPAPE